MNAQSILECGGVRWKEASPGEITYFVWHCEYMPERQDFEIETIMIPEGDEFDEDGMAPGEEARLILRANVPQTNDWAGMEDTDVKFDPGIWIDDEPATAGMEEPEVEFWSLGREGSDGQIFACGCWDVGITFGKMDRETLEIPYRVEAFYPTDEAREAYKKWYRENWKQLNDDDCHEAFARTKLRTGWQLDFRGTAMVSQFHCIVPINTDRPVDYARTMIANRLGLRVPLRGHVNGGDWLNETFDQEDGITDSGRIVCLYVD